MTRATVRKVGDQIVIDDPDAVEMIQAVNKHNCQKTLDMNIDRILHFKNRIAERGDTAEDWVIVLINVDNPQGKHLADALMPGANWQQYRDQGQVPFARGLAHRIGIQKLLDEVDKAAADKLLGMSGVCAVVVDYGTTEVYPV